MLHSQGSRSVQPRHTDQPTVSQRLAASNGGCQKLTKGQDKVAAHPRQTLRSPDSAAPPVPRRVAPRHTGPLVTPWKRMEKPATQCGKAKESVSRKNSFPFLFFSGCPKVCPCLSVTCVFYFCSTSPPTLCLCPCLLAQIFSMAKASNIITMVYFPLFII